MTLANACVISICCHGLLAVGASVLVSNSARPDVAASIEVSSVDLSFSDEVAESAEAVAACPPPKDEAPSRQAPERPVLPDKPADDMPPQAPELDDLPQPTPQANDQMPDPQTPPEPPPKPQPPEKPHPVAKPQPVAEMRPAPRQARIDSPARPRRQIKPDYPESSRQRGEEGVVTLSLEISSEGTVVSAEIEKSTGFPELDGSALRAVRAARFVPAKSGGKPVASKARLQLRFKLK